MEREKKNEGPSRRSRLTFFFFLFSFVSFLFFPKLTNERKNMAYGRRYKAKLHVLEEDDLASILTPAPPCKVPGLGTKGPFFYCLFCVDSFFSSLFFFVCFVALTRRGVFGADRGYFSSVSAQIDAASVARTQNAALVWWFWCLEKCPRVRSRTEQVNFFLRRSFFVRSTDCS